MVAKILSIVQYDVRPTDGFLRRQLPWHFCLYAKRFRLLKQLEDKGDFKGSVVQPFSFFFFSTGTLFPSQPLQTCTLATVTVFLLTLTRWNSCMALTEHTSPIERPLCRTVLGSYLLPACCVISIGTLDCADGILSVQQGYGGRKPRPYKALFLSHIHSLTHSLCHAG